MTDNADYRLYLESNFKSLHHELSEIKAQTTKTNGTVQRHEQIIASSLPHWENPLLLINPASQWIQEDWKFIILELKKTVLND